MCRAIAFSLLDRTMDEIATYEQIVERFGSVTDPATAGIVAKAHELRAEILTSSDPSLD